MVVCRVWHEAHFVPILLTQVFRQTDVAFVDLLGQMRVGQVTEESRSALTLLCTVHRKLSENGA